MSRAWVLAIAWTGVALAQPLPVPRGPEQLTAGVEFGASGGGPASGTLLASSTEVGLRWRMIESLVLDASWGVTVASTHVHGELDTGSALLPYSLDVDRVQPGNPQFSASYAGHFGDLHLMLGLGVGVPAAARAEIGNDAAGAAVRAASESTLIAAAAMRGWWSPWRWAPERVSFFAPIRLLYERGTYRFGVDAGIGLMLPVLGDRGVNVDVAMQLAVDGGVRVVEGGWLGLRVQAVGAPSGVTVPPITIAIEPWVGARSGAVWFTTRGLLNLAGMDGIGQARGPSFGIMIGASADMT